jgi:beta-lactamase regulating signal transducer with metallopeptidase domain
MDFMSINTLQNLGMSIFHSIWQIGLICFIYFFILLTRKRLSINHKYNSGLFSLALAAVLFILTFQVIKNENANKPHGDSVNTAMHISHDDLSINAQEKQVIESQKNISLFSFDYSKILTIINEFAAVIGAIWILGLMFFVFRKILAYYNLKRIKNNEYNVRSAKWEKALREISSRLNLKKKVDILFSPFVNSPLSFGFLKPVILFPLRLTTGLSTEEIRCILIHELAHNLRNDYFYNIFQHVIETLFFYHPGIWWISKNIRTQREILCDRIVLDNQISEKYYANTLLKLSELQLSDANLAIAARRSKNELFTRIKHIINKPDNSLKIKRNPGIGRDGFILKPFRGILEIY